MTRPYTTDDMTRGADALDRQLADRPRDPDSYVSREMGQIMADLAASLRDSARAQALTVSFDPYDSEGAW
jgi:hypothetical protein